MRAMGYRRYGGPDVIEELEWPAPRAGRGSVVVRVRASSVNPIDTTLASGRVRWVMPVARPAVAGFDVAGEIEAIGEGVSELRVGQRVCARLGTRTGGASAELVDARAEWLAPLPDHVDDAQAAALPLAGMTALQALRDTCGMRLEGESRRVLVVGGSGGVGTFAVQLAARAGARVSAVCSARNAELVRSLGAATVFDHADAQDWGEHEIVIECSGGHAPWSRLSAATARRGSIALVSLAAAHLARVPLGALGLGAHARPVMLRVRGEDLRWLVARMGEGSLRSHVGARFEMRELADAWRASLSARVPGKIVVAGFTDSVPEPRD